jgi:hypothetical protein
MKHDAQYFDTILNRTRGTTQGIEDLTVAHLSPHDENKQTIINNYTTQNITYELVHYVNVDYGSSEDQAPKIQSAIDNAEPGDSLRFKDGLVTIRSTVNVSKQVSLIGSHNTIFQVHGNYAIFEVSSAYVIIAHMRFLGTSGAKGSGSNTNQHGIKYVSADGDGLRVAGIQANNLNGAMFFSDSVGSVTLDAASLTDCVAYNCKTGYDLDNSAHINLVGCRAISCGTGVALTSTNVQVVGGSFISCTNGMSISKGYCVITGVTIADCSGFSLYCSGISAGLGATVSGSSIKGADIILQTCDGFNINGCEIEVADFTIDTCTVILSGNYMFSTPAATLVTGGQFVGGNNFKYVGSNNLTAWS